MRILERQLVPGLPVLGFSGSVLRCRLVKWPPRFPNFSFSALASLELRQVDFFVVGNSIVPTIPALGKERTPETLATGIEKNLRRR